MEWKWTRLAAAMLLGVLAAFGIQEVTELLAGEHLDQGVRIFIGLCAGWWAYTMIPWVKTR